MASIKLAVGAVVLGLCCAGQPARAAAPEPKRAVVVGFVGNAPPSARKQLARATRDAIHSVTDSTKLSAQGCSELYAALVSLGEDPDECETGTISQVGLTYLAPQYYVTGEVMAVTGTYYVTIRHSRGVGGDVETITLQHTNLGALETRVREEVAYALANRMVVDRFLSKMPNIKRSAPEEKPVAAAPPDAGATPPPTRVAAATPTEKAPAEKAPEPKQSPPAATETPPEAKKDPSPAPSTTATTTAAATSAPAKASTASPFGTQAVPAGLVVTERLARRKEFAWDAANSFVLSDVQQYLRSQGMEPVDVTPLLGSSAAQVKQDGNIGGSIARRVFVDKQLKHGFALRLIYTDMGASKAGGRDLHVSLMARRYALPVKKGVGPKRVQHEQVVACADNAPEDCRKKVMAVVEQALKPLLDGGTAR